MAFVGVGLEVVVPGDISNIAQLASRRAAVSNPGVDFLIKKKLF